MFYTQLGHSPLFDPKSVQKKCQKLLAVMASASILIESMYHRASNSVVGPKIPISQNGEKSEKHDCYVWDI